MKTQRTVLSALVALTVLASTPAFAAGYVKLYKDAGFIGSSVTSRLNKSIPDLHPQGFGDETSSVKYNIPAGWTVILHADAYYHGSTRVLQGNGSISDLGRFGDKVSSVEWRR